MRAGAIYIAASLALAVGAGEAVMVFILCALGKWRLRLGASSCITLPRKSKEPTLTFSSRVCADGRGIRPYAAEALRLERHPHRHGIDQHLVLAGEEAPRWCFAPRRTGGPGIHSVALWARSAGQR